LSPILHNRIILIGSSKDHDFAAVARRLVEQAMGEKPDGSPLDRQREKNPAAAAPAKLGGTKSGAASLSLCKRSLIPKKAAQTRWENSQRSFRRHYLPRKESEAASLVRNTER
jgi:hypothetical protein